MLTPLPVTPEAWERAGEFWAIVRQQGKPTAADADIDGDAILAGVAATSGRADDINLVIAPNFRHFHRFPGILADRWEDA